MRAIKIMMFLSLMIAGNSHARAGGIIIDGTDANEHGRFVPDIQNPSGGRNQDGWLYMQRALEALGKQAPSGNAKMVIVLGTIPGTDARDAIQSAFEHSSLVESGWDIDYKQGAEAISDWLTNISVSNTGILYITTYTETEGDLTPDEMAVINEHGSDIADFVGQAGVIDRGGALFAMAESGTDADGNQAYEWLKTVVPGILVVDKGITGVNTPIKLTIDGLRAGLPEEDTAHAIPWHDHFEFAEGSSPRLAVWGTARENEAERNIILGPPIADLEITKAASPDPVKVGSQLTYTINAINNGPNAAMAVTLTDSLPPGLKLDSIVGPADWSCNESVVGNGVVITCSTPVLQAGATKSLQITATAMCPADQSTTITNTAIINSSTFDGAQSNNTASVTVGLEGAGRATLQPSTVEFIKTKARVAGKIKKLKEETFTIKNTGCAPLNLRFASIKRTGADVTSGRISNPDDSNLFILVDDVSGDVVPLGSSIEALAVGQEKKFRVQFNPVIPEVASSTTGLHAIQVLPQDVTSRLTFTQADGPDVTLNLKGHVKPIIRLIAPKNPVRPASVRFEKSGNKAIVTFFVFNSNRDIESVEYKFFKTSGEEIPIREGDEKTSLGELAQRFVVGQSFGVMQAFVDINEHPRLATVRVTVRADAGGSDSAEASLAAATATAQSVQSNGNMVLSLPVKRLAPALKGDRSGTEKKGRRKRSL